jgi:hypothetical protein
VDALVRTGALAERRRRLLVTPHYRRERRGSTGLPLPFLPFETEAR